MIFELPLGQIQNHINMAVVTLSLQQSGPTAMRLQNDVQVVVDRPVQQGGGGSGLMGGQYLLTGIAGCFCSTLFAAAAARDIEIAGLSVSVKAELSESLPKRFSHISLEVSYEQCNAPSQFINLLRVAEKGCISMNTVKSGLSLEVTSQT